MITQRLREIEVAFPQAPDMTDAVTRRLEMPAPTPRLVRAAVALGLVLVVVLAIPSARNSVAAWLGIESLVITSSDDPLVDAATTRVTVDAVVVEPDEAASAVGFAPFFSPTLSEPQRTLVADGIVWMFFAPDDDLPEGRIAGIGAIVTQWHESSGVVDFKTLPLDAPDAAFAEVGGHIGFWFGSDHAVEIRGPAGGVEELRPAGPTLIWQVGEVIIRLESALGQEAAVKLAESFGNR